MIRAVEVLVFGGAAVGLHLAVLGAFDAPGGGEPAQAGASAVAMQAPDAALRALVAEWERPPEPAAAPEVVPPAGPVAPDLRPLAEPARPPALGAAGTAPRPAASGLPAAEAAALTRGLATAVRAAIARAQRYPPQARSRGITGTAVIRVTIGRDGGLRGVALVRSSGSEMLDAAAVASARAVGRYPAAPDDLPGESFTFEAGLVFDLR